ncbi:MAG: right-handed parallel beta-helix repeat-containing protein [Candidatus Heimdallarchaeaceae archaeon]
MSKKKKIIVFLEVIILILAANNFNIVIKSESKSLERINISFKRIYPSRDYIVHEPIIVNNDQNLTDYGFPGSGTLDDPYRIEGYNITGDYKHGISISHTTKYVVIQNCYIKGITKGGIIVYNVSEGTVTVANNIVRDSRNVGIDVLYSPKTAIVNNTCLGIGNGIGVGVGFYSNGTIIANNYCYKNGMSGIGVGISNDVIITNNTVTTDYYFDSWSGIYCGFSENITIIGNFASNHKLYGGISIYNVKNTRIVNNTCIDNIQGNMFIEECQDILIANNTSMHTTWSGNDLLGWGIVVSVVENVTVYNNHCLWDVNGLALLHSAKKVIAKDNYIAYCTNGIDLYNMSNAIIYGNTLYSNGYGVYVEANCANNTIHHNNFTKNNIPEMSQAYDAGVNNTWYDPLTLEGNYWSDWNGTGIYPIDGPANSFDPYPLPRPPSHSFSLFHYWWFDLSLVLFSSLILSVLYIVSRRLKLFKG